MSETYSGVDNFFNILMISDGQNVMAVLFVALGQLLLVLWNLISSKGRSLNSTLVAISVLYPTVLLIALTGYLLTHFSDYNEFRSYMFIFVIFFGPAFLTALYSLKWVIPSFRPIVGWMQISLITLVSLWNLIVALAINGFASA